MAKKLQIHLALSNIVKWILGRVTNHSLTDQDGDYIVNLFTKLCINSIFLLTLFLSITNNKSNLATFIYSYFKKVAISTTFLQYFHNKLYVVSCY